MGPDDERRRLSKLASKLGTVATAAAALLAESTASAHESDVLKGLLNRNDMVTSVSRETEGPAELLPPLLILKPKGMDTDGMLAGHRSHSSHRSHGSHSSHSSGSSHASHFSSSVRTGPGIRSSRRSRAFTTSPFDPSSSWRDSSSTPPEQEERPTPPPRVKARPAPVVETAPAVDRRDPLYRYQLITIGNFSGIPKAFIKDHLAGESKLLKTGDTIGECKLMEIFARKGAVLLKPIKGPEFTITRSQAAK